jgi:hypothetical protein
MSHRTTVLVSRAGLVVLGIAGMLLAPGARGEGDQEGKDVPAVKKVGDQDAALGEAREVDLLLLKRSDKVVIEESRRGGKGRRVTLDRAEDVKELRQALKVRSVPPSGGVTAATLSFYRGGHLLRKVWVFEGGEWGFERPGTSWTTGRDGGLWKVVAKHLPE